jgi:hypothetical protein
MSRHLSINSAEYSDAEIERIRDDVQVLAEISVESYLKQKNEKSFEYPEDEQFFASLLAGGSKEELREKFLHRFDFREPSLKRTVFDKLKRLVNEDSEEIQIGGDELYEPRCLTHHPIINEQVK